MTAIFHIIRKAERTATSKSAGAALMCVNWPAIKQTDTSPLSTAARLRFPQFGLGAAQRKRRWPVLARMPVGFAREVSNVSQVHPP
jgi:hypothetical protein